MAKTKIMRVSRAFDEYCEKMARELSKTFGKNVSKTEVTKIISKAEWKVIKRRKDKKNLLL